MKLFSSEISIASGEETAKAVIMNKSRNGYELLNYYNTEPENLKALSGDKTIHFAINYFDTIIETLNVPNIKDPKTFKILAENKLKERMEEGIDYLMAYKAKDGAVPGKSGNIEHKVYLIPSSLYTKSDIFTERQKARTSVFTLSDFGLCGISAKAFPDDIVFHCFADGEKIIINVSHGKTIIYTRAMDYEASGDMLMDSVFYESINLTYMFVTKNLKVDVQRIVLSGKMVDRPELSKMLFDFNTIPQTVALPGEFVKGCSREVFHDFLIPISLCMIDDAYDFTPVEYKELRGFNILKTIVNSILILLAVLIFYFNINSFQQLGFANERYNAESNVIKLKLDRNVNNFKDTEDQKYGFYYLNQIKKYNRSAFDLYADTADILDSGDYDRIIYLLDEKSKSAILNIRGNLKFDSLKEIDSHKQKLEKKLAFLSSKKKMKIENRSRYNMDLQKAEIRISIEKVRR